MLSNEADLDLRILLTHSAERFLPRQTVAWHAGEVYSSDDPGLNPAEFAMRSLGIVVLPATANMLAAAALGLAATPAQTAVLAAERPCLFFPSTSASMWAKRTTQRHLAALREDGHTVVEPTERQVYVMWQREFAPNPAMPPPETATEIIISWLEDGLGSPPPEAVPSPEVPAGNGLAATVVGPGRRPQPVVTTPHGAADAERCR
jgi:Flavoprotein